MTKLVLKCGDIEVEYDGPEDFLRSELPKLIEEIARLRGTPSTTAHPAGGLKTPPPALPAGETSVTTIAQKLGVASCADIVLAAALSLTPVGNEVFTKKALRERARGATTYYKASYRNNFDDRINRHVKAGRLNHMGGDNYVLPDLSRRTLLEKIAAAK